MGTTTTNAVSPRLLHLLLLYGHYHLMILRLNILHGELHGANGGGLRAAKALTPLLSGL